MTGRDLIVYILSNDLEDAPVFEDGSFLGFMNVQEAAAKFGVGSATIRVWVVTGELEGYKFGSEFYIPMNAECPGHGAALEPTFEELLNKLFDK